MTYEADLHLIEFSNTTKYMIVRVTLCDKVPGTTSRLGRLHDLRPHDFHDFTTRNRSRNWVYNATMSFYIDYKSS